MVAMIADGRALEEGAGQIRFVHISDTQGNKFPSNTTTRMQGMRQGERSELKKWYWT